MISDLKSGRDRRSAGGGGLASSDQGTRLGRAAWSRGGGGSGPLQSRFIEVKNIGKGWGKGLEAEGVSIPRAKEHIMAM